MSSEDSDTAPLEKSKKLCAIGIVKQYVLSCYQPSKRKCNHKEYGPSNVSTEYVHLEVSKDYVVSKFLKNMCSQSCQKECTSLET